MRSIKVVGLAFLLGTALPALGCAQSISTDVAVPTAEGPAASADTTASKSRMRRGWRSAKRRKSYRLARRWAPYSSDYYYSGHVIVLGVRN
jgi:hypothetical protein